MLLKLLLKDRRGREIMMQPGEGYFIINKSYVSDLFCLLKADVALINPKNENEVNNNIILISHKEIHNQDKAIQHKIY